MKNLKILLLAAMTAGLLTGCVSSYTTVLPTGNYYYPTGAYYLQVPVTEVTTGAWYYPANSYYSYNYRMVLPEVGCGGCW